MHLCIVRPKIIAAPKLLVLIMASHCGIIGRGYCTLLSFSILTVRLLSSYFRSTQIQFILISPFAFNCLYFSDILLNMDRITKAKKCLESVKLTFSMMCTVFLCFCELFRTNDLVYFLTT